ncbi:MAG: hypothetical protein ACI959_002156 [Limisphaerales bacterium]|jgi:hypothetical protein
MNTHHRICLLLALIPSMLMAQNFSYADLQVLEVSFSGPTLDMRKDDGTGWHVAPHYTPTAHTPVAYISGDAPVAEGQFQITCDNLPDSIWVKGLGPDAINFPPVKVAVQGTGTTRTFNYPATSSDNVFEDQVVRFFKPFTINWEFTFGVGLDESWRTIGSSANTLYVTKEFPMPETIRFKWFQTVYDMSCRNADALETEADIIAGVWEEFTDHVLLNWEGDSLHYYNTLNTSNVTLSTLLKYRNAQCYTFAQLFLSTIKIQGLVRTNNYVYITPINNSVCGNTVNRFIVKNWEFSIPNSTACPDFPYQNTYTTLVPPPYLEYDFIIESVSDKEGIPGASTNNPASYFNNHQITFIDGVYYDPCYGVTFDALTDIKNEAFDGWSYRYFSGGVTNAFFTSDMTLSELAPTITTF